MSNLKIKNAEFVLGVSDLNTMPENELPEIALIGRSNVGKSTLVNKLTGRRALARTSKTPGRTQQLNLFKVSLTEEKGDRQLCLVDLPGYGFAKFSKKRREHLASYIVDYLHGREELKVVCLLNDCRRDPEDEELDLRDLVFESGRHLIVVLTKVDKLGSNEKRKRISEIAKCYGLEPEDLVLSGEKSRPEELWSRILPLI